MDIEEIKKFIRNKIETDNLTQKVRDVIKITKWKKQDVREGFKESFKPLIKAQDKISESIKEQKDATIEQLKNNQLALTEGLRANRLALTEGLRAIGELPEPEIYEQEKEGPSKEGPSKEKTPIKLNVEKDLSIDEINRLSDMGYVRPNEFGKTDPQKLKDTNYELKNDIKTITGQINGFKRKKEKTEEDKLRIEMYEDQKNLMKNYQKILDLFLKSIEYQTGKGIYFNNPHQLLDRLELLSGSILAGNNGVIPEFSQIAHLLNQMKVISKKQLNDLLKTYI